MWRPGSSTISTTRCWWRVASLDLIAEAPTKRPRPEQAQTRVGGALTRASDMARRLMIVGRPDEDRGSEST